MVASDPLFRGKDLHPLVESFVDRGPEGKEIRDWGKSSDHSVRILNEYFIKLWVLPSAKAQNFQRQIVNCCQVTQDVDDSIASRRDLLVKRGFSQARNKVGQACGGQPPIAKDGLNHQIFHLPCVLSFTRAWAICRRIILS